MNVALSKKIEDSIEPVLDRMGLCLVHGTFRRERGGRVLRLFIERRDATPENGSGVDVGLCASVSRELSCELDVADVIKDAYTLEVSSPGIERPLVRSSDFERFAGRLIKITTKKALDGIRTFEGTLNGIEDKTISLTTKRSQKVSIPCEIIKKAHLVFDYKR